MRAKFWLSVLMSAALTACAGPLATVAAPDAPVAVPQIEALTLNPVQWQVMTVPQLKKLVADLDTAQNNQTILYSLNKQNYDNLSLNLIEIERYLNEQKAILNMLQTIINQRAAQAPK